MVHDHAVFRDLAEADRSFVLLPVLLFAGPILSSQDASNLSQIVVGQGEMSLVFDEPGVADRDGIGDVVADRNRDILVLSSVPQVNLGSDVLKSEAPRPCVLPSFVMDPGNPGSKCLREGKIDDLLRQLGPG